MDDRAVIARKAGWAYRRSAERLGIQSAPRGVFELQHLAAWDEHRWYAEQVARGAHLEFDAPCLADRLLITWHFPEYPLLLPIVAEQGALVLIANDEAWLRAGSRGAELCLFRNPGAVMAVARAFRLHRPVVAMLDYCYDETASVIANFCGYPARTPSGVFQLARRFGYAADVIELSADGTPVVIDSFTPGADVAAAAARVNVALERSIMSAPPRWLLWASVDRRWLGVDYEAGSPAGL
jgi:hypothetical protein